MNIETQYLKLLTKISKNGVQKKDRTKERNKHNIKNENK